MKLLGKIIYWTLIVLALIQFIPVDRSNPPVKSREDFVNIHQTPANITSVLKKACYDCHSNQTRYPNYAYVAPISWSIKHHVNEGREHLNLSVWGTYSRELKKGMLENSAADLKQNRMPIPGYMAQHPEARLSEAERKLLVNYFEGILKKGNY